MTNIQLISDELRGTNQIEINRVRANLMNQRNILQKIKSEIVSLRGKFDSMFSILQYYPDQISEVQKQLYDVQTQGFLHSCFMALGLRDDTASLYINPVTDVSKQTEINLSIIFPHGTVTDTIALIDNISINVETWTINFGDNVINALNASTIQQNFTTIEEQTAQIYTKNSFILGITEEIKKLAFFMAIICKNEQIISAGIRYVGDIRDLNLA